MREFKVGDRVRLNSNYHDAHRWPGSVQKHLLAKSIFTVKEIRLGDYEPVILATDDNLYQRWKHEELVPACKITVIL